MKDSRATPLSNVSGMSSQRLTRRVAIANPEGFHLRPQRMFVECARKYPNCTVTLSLNEKRVNGKDLFDLMLLSVNKGTELTLEVTGPEAQAAIEELAAILAAESLDDGTTEPPSAEKGLIPTGVA
ncbi:MAG: hypothetical protein KatS3mg105_1411 [Gemmatales bacterium]|nr:MAG: hypothetical protein KatS3mg105_1411 [Gemmatales bacterium]